MKAKKRLKSRLLGGAILSAVALLGGLNPAVAFAQTPLAKLVLYEVAEALTFKGASSATDADEFVRRLATATLLGKEVVPLSSPAMPPFAAGSFVVIEASSKVNLATGMGPIRGTAYILTDIDPTRNSLDTLVVNALASLQGQLNLSTASKGVAWASGRWRIRDSYLRGTWEGVFLIPFKGSAIGLPGALGDQYWYVDPNWYVDPSTPGLGAVAGSCTSLIAGLCPLGPDEFALGIPLTKAVIVLFQ